MLQQHKHISFTYASSKFPAAGDLVKQLCAGHNDSSLDWQADAYEIGQSFILRWRPYAVNHIKTKKSTFEEWKNINDLVSLLTSAEDEEDEELLVEEDMIGSLEDSKSAYLNYARSTTPEDVFNVNFLPTMLLS